MKKHFIFCLALLMGASAYAQSGEKTIQVTVSNDWKESKTDEPVVIDLRTLDLGFTVKSATVWDGSTEIPSQLDDMNGDARADELALLVNMPAKSSKDLRIVLATTTSWPIFLVSRLQEPKMSIVLFITTVLLLKVN